MRFLFSDEAPLCATWEPTNWRSRFIPGTKPCLARALSIVCYLLARCRLLAPNGLGRCARDVRSSGQRRSSVEAPPLPGLTQSGHASVRGRNGPFTFGCHVLERRITIRFARPDFWRLVQIIRPRDRAQRSLPAERSVLAQPNQNCSGHVGLDAVFEGVEPDALTFQRFRQLFRRNPHSQAHLREGVIDLGVC